MVIYLPNFYAVHNSLRLQKLLDWKRLQAGRSTSTATEVLDRF